MQVRAVVRPSGGVSQAAATVSGIRTRFRPYGTAAQGSRVSIIGALPKRDGDPVNPARPACVLFHEAFSSRREGTANDKPGMPEVTDRLHRVNQNARRRPWVSESS